MAEDRTLLYIVGAGAVLWLISRRSSAAPARGAVATARVVPSFDLATKPEDLVSYPANDPNVDLTPLFCSPFDEYGGWGDDRKVAEASRLYIERYGFSPTPEFDAAVRRRDPCNRSHIDRLISAFPPFPGQTFKASELAEKKRRQGEAREAKARDEKAAQQACVDRAVGAATVIVSTGAAIAGGVVTGGAAVLPAAGAGAAVGGAAGRFISGLWC
ncbi:MAG: hypothetical protein ACO29H_07450 [Opitutales bacterium]